MSKGRKIEYSARELAWIEKHKTLVRKEAHALFCKKFKRTDVTHTNYKALCTRMGWKTGRDGRMKPGNISWNKGKKMPYNPNTARHQFKKGNVPHNTLHLYAERTTKDGYIEISVPETNPYTGFERRFVLKHRWEWEKLNGKIPDNHCLKCLDGDKTNTSPENWELIHREMLPRLSGRFGRGYEQAEPEVKPLIMNVTKLEHQAKTLSKNKTERIKS